ncbi:MAG: hypothetical protein OXH65_01480 [Paracoccaceae bacterium]|nr:hypothetical protein [Paracoccaceae bacterium]
MEEEIYELLSTASFNLESALSVIHHCKDGEKFIQLAERIIRNTKQLKRTLGINSDD